MATNERNKMSYETMVDRMVQQRLEADSAYINAATIEEQSAREQQIVEEVEDQINYGYDERD